MELDQSYHQSYPVHVVALHDGKSIYYYVLSEAQYKAIPQGTEWAEALRELEEKKELLGAAICLTGLFFAVVQNKWRIVDDHTGPLG